ncbi:hypothetical protein V6Z11_D05G259900 [Gossypium hirsutum]
MIGPSLSFFFFLSSFSSSSSPSTSFSLCFFCFFLFFSPFSSSSFSLNLVFYHLLNLGLFLSIQMGCCSTKTKRSNPQQNNGYKSRAITTVAEQPQATRIPEKPSTQAPWKPVVPIKYE